MTLRLAAFSIGALLTSHPHAAGATMVDLKWTDGSFTHKSGVAPGKFLEVCGKLKKDQKIAWRFTGSAPTDFNIHYHVGKDVVYSEQRKAAGSAEGVLVVPLDQDYCWMWSNKSAQALDITLQLGQTGN